MVPLFIPAILQEITSAIVENERPAMSQSRSIKGVSDPELRKPIPECKNVDAVRR